MQVKARKNRTTQVGNCAEHHLYFIFDFTVSSEPGRYILKIK